ncbi:MAG: hypothetical protein ACO3JL_21145 [Myxococcota bacterium]
MLSEDEGRAVLREVFTSHGSPVSEDHLLCEEDLRVVVDGWSVDTQVGYEFVSSADRERKGLTPAVLRALERSMAQGRLYLFLIDATDIGTREELAGAARSFLRFVAERRKAEGR